MKKRVLFFFPHNPYPPKSGAHRRCLEILAGLRELGCETAFASSTLFSETEWTETSIAALKKEWVKNVHVHYALPSNFKTADRFRTFYRILRKRLPVNSMMYTPTGMKEWFSRVVEDVHPDMVIMNYAHWDGLVDHRALNSVTRVIETHDLITLNLRMWESLKKKLPPSPMESTQIDDSILEEDFFERLRLRADPEEFRIFDKYDFTMTLSAREEEIIKRNTRKTRTVLTPMTLEPVSVDNTYSENAVFPTGPNPFNVQGYFYFLKKVLPRVVRETESFRLQVTGHWCYHVKPENDVILSGYVQDLKEVYGSARFLVCPIFGGTGQQVKIVEAMAHGVPVIALRFSAEGSPIQNGVNGLVASNAEEFAEHVVLLWKDRNLCKRLGNAARETIASQFSKACLIEKLSVLTL